ncbi:hypothetical protein GmHk_14G041963 [Glycine max]|nr:hypothetical protein GmHk_14G041963 [Glycine max]
MMRQEEVIQGVFHMKAQNSRGDKDRKNNKWRNKKPEGSNKQQGETFLHCPHCKKTNHPQRKCWWRPDVNCRNCGNMGHVERICKSKPKKAKVVAEEQEDEQLFVATCFATSNSFSDSWLMDNGCTNHMTNDLKLFKDKVFSYKKESCFKRHIYTPNVLEL